MKKFILLITLIVVSQAVKADESVRVDCVSFDSWVSVDFFLEKEGLVKEMRLLDRRTNYYSVVPLYANSRCLKEEVCYRGHDFNYDYRVDLPDEIFSEDRPETFRVFGELNARHRRNFQYLRFSLNCIVW